MKLTKRLAAVCGELEKCDTFADVGCDHGYCTLYMLENGLCRTAQISDISAKSLKKAQALLSAYIAEGRVCPVVCDGLAGIDRGTEQVLIAGMGGEEIVKILSDGFLPPKLVLQPMKNAEKVRAFLLGRGYALLHDHTFYADKKFYDLIKAVKGGKQEEYNKDMLSFGRENIISPTEDFAKMLERDISRCREWRESAAEGRAEIDARLKKLEGLYDETCRRLRSH